MRLCLCTDELSKQRGHDLALTLTRNLFARSDTRVPVTNGKLEPDVFC